MAWLPAFLGTCSANGQWQGHHGWHRCHVHERHHGWRIPSFGAPADFRRGGDAGGQVLASNHHTVTAVHAHACGPVPAAKFGSSGREYEAPRHALEIPGPYQVAVGYHGRLELRAR